MLDRFLGAAGEIAKVVMALSVVGIVGFLLMSVLRLANFKNHTMPAAIILTVVFFVAFEVKSIAGKFAASQGRRHTKIMEKADVLAREKKYAEAAELYIRQAQKEGKTSDLAFSIYSRYAFGMWIKAGEPRKALQEAGNVLWGYVANNGMWMKYNSGDDVEKLTSMVSDFFGAGYIAEGAFLAGEVNKELERFGLPMRCAAVPVGKNVFPVSCSNCGANVFSNPYHDIARCEYCKATIYPINEGNSNTGQSASSDTSPHCR